MASSSTAAGPSIRHPRNPDATLPPSIVHLSFNHLRSLFAVGTTDGYMIFNTNSFVLTRHRYFPQHDRHGDFAIVQMDLDTRKFALVCGLNLNRVRIWDDAEREFMGWIEFHSEVKSVRLWQNRLVAVTMQKVLIYNIIGFLYLHEIETGPNPKGLCEVSHSEQMVLVCLGSDKGEVSVVHYSLRSNTSTLIKAHDSDVACLALSYDGRLLATAGTEGTLVRVFDASDGRLLQELRRDSEGAEIHSLCFSYDAELLAVSCNKGAVHIFRLNTGSSSMETDGPQEAEQNNISLSRLSSFKGILSNSFSSKWPMAQFRVPEDIQHIVEFGHQTNTILIGGTNGRFYRCKFDPIAGGEMTQMECHNYLQPELDS
ncbi:UNVERIFIED_CONTAM: Autophagy-related protein 18a [Sesamum indicum]